MNDWLEPPEELEPEECGRCTDGLMVEFIGLVNMLDPMRATSPVLACDCCGAVQILDPEPDYEIQPDIEISDEDLEEQVQAWSEAHKMCPHGLEWSECNACMVAGDLAYDAAREARLINRRW